MSSGFSQSVDTKLIWENEEVKHMGKDKIVEHKLNNNSTQSGEMKKSNTTVLLVCLQINQMKVKIKNTK